MSSYIHPKEARCISTTFAQNPVLRIVFSALQIESVPFFMPFVSVSLPATSRLSNPVLWMETCKHFSDVPKTFKSDTQRQPTSGPGQKDGATKMLGFNSQTQEPTQDLLTFGFACQSNENLKRKAESDPDRTTKRFKVSIGTAVDLCD